MAPTRAGCGRSPSCCWRLSSGSGGHRLGKRRTCAMPPDAAAADLLVSAFLDTIERRIRLLDVLRAAALGVLTTAAAFVPVRLLGLASGPALLVAATFGLIAGGAIAWLRRARRPVSAAAALVERALPESRNVVFTARELIATP